MASVLRSLLRNRTRSLLTCLGVAVAVAAMVSLVSVGQGAIRMFFRLMTRQADLLVYQRRAADLMLSSVPIETIQACRQEPGVAHASGVVLAPVSVEGADVFTVLGVEAGSENQRQLPVVAGTAFGPGARHEMMLGAIAAEILGKGVGDELEVYEDRFRITAVYRSDIGFQDAGAVIPLVDAQRIVEKPRHVSVVHVQVADPTRIDAVRTALARAHPDMRVLRTSEFRDEYLQFQAIQFFAGAVSLIAFLLGGVGVANTFLMSVSERRQEFGVLRAVGWSPRRVLALVLQEVFLLCVAGFLLGATLAVMALEFAKTFPSITQYVQGGYSLELFAGCFLATLLLGLLSGAYPALRASRVDPLEVLRGTA